MFARPFVSLLAGALAALCATAAALAAPAIPEQRLGAHFDIRPEGLPAPYATRSAGNPPETIARPEGAVPHVPAGFRANVFAAGMPNARWLAVAPNGDVFLAQSNDGKITLLRDANGDGMAERNAEYAGGFSQPHGLLVHGGALYVGDTRNIWRIAYKDGDTRAGARRPILAEGALGAGHGHWTRNLAADSRGRIFVSIGSMSNVNEEPKPHAAISRVEGGRLVTFASGLRNPVGIAFYPGTDNLFTVVNERDGLGDGLVPDYLTHVVDGAFYGWPYAYIGPNPDPDFGTRRPDLVKSARVPDLLFQAHSAALGLAFYTGTQFPAAYRGGAFVTLHGSWNSARPTGYKVVFVPFAGGRPKGGYDNFATGFWQSGTGRAQVWGRPVGIAVARDGSLLIADDVADVVWRVSYSGG
jgi:glucose/arabinose dehydrogenase